MKDFWEDPAEFMDMLMDIHFQRILRRGHRISAEKMLEKKMVSMDVELFVVKNSISDEVRAKMKEIVHDAPEEVKKRDNQSILRWAYTQALAKEQK